MYSVIVMSMLLAPQPEYRSKTVTRGGTGCQGVQASYAIPVNPQGFRAAGCAGHAGGVSVTVQAASGCTGFAGGSYALPAYGASYAAFGGHRREKHKEIHHRHRTVVKHKAHGHSNPVAVLVGPSYQSMPRMQSSCPTCPNYVAPPASKAVQ